MVSNWVPMVVDLGLHLSPVLLGSNHIFISSEVWNVVVLWVFIFWCWLMWSSGVGFAFERGAVWDRLGMDFILNLNISLGNVLLSSVSSSSSVAS